MTHKIFSIHDPGERQIFTGERYTIGVSGEFIASSRYVSEIT
jgi:hypothetical protein